MKRAIIVKGQSNSGKTMVLTDFYNWMVTTLNPVVVSYHPFPNGDFKAILRFNNLQISFFTQGDYGVEVEDFIKGAIKFGSDIIIFCCRTRGGTFDAVKNHLTKPGFIVDYVHTYHVPTAHIGAFHNQILDELKARSIGIPK